MNRVLDVITPSRAEVKKFKAVVASVLSVLNRHLSDATAILGGSGAKGTWLSGSFDVDIFVQYDYRKYASKSEELSRYLEPVLGKAFPRQKIEKLHGSRDYFHFPYQGITVEVVPILKLKKAEEAVNITDVSPLHAKWVNAHTRKLKGEILLAKQFSKANGVYGAESYLGGFSGYVLEILIAYYGSFRKLLKASQSWKVKGVIDVEKHYPKRDALFHLNQSKLQSPLIVIDPVDKNRNAAAALSFERWELFRARARDYLRCPGDHFFVRNAITVDTVRTKADGKAWVFVVVEPLQGKEDVVGAKVRKVFQLLQRELAPFTIFDAGWELDKEGRFYFILEKPLLPSVEVRIGPPLKLSDHVAEFRKKYSKVFEEKGRICARLARECITPESCVKQALQSKKVTENVARILKVETSS